MFADIYELRDILSLMIEVIDERNELMQENLYLREKLKQKEDEQMELYHKNISTTADILNTLINKADK